MMEFIQQVTKQLGMDESRARSLTGGLLGVVKQQVPAGDFDGLMRALPGAADLVQEPAAATSQGALGRLGGGLASMLAGDKGGAALELTGLFQRSGLGNDQGRQFATMFVNFIRDKAGSDLAGRLLGKLPALKALLG